jgi:membrane protease YdiL (CAAX protease family)
LLISLIIILVVGTFLFTGFLLAGTKIFDIDFGNWGDLISKDVGEDSSRFLRFLLISQDISYLLIPGIIILILMKPVPKVSLSDLKLPHINKIALVIVMAFCIFPITSFAGQLSSEMQLPGWLSGLEGWMREKEDSANRIVDILLIRSTLKTLLFNLLMIAVLPAIGEEMIFRGVFQKILCKLLKSGHLAVWVMAFLFSAVHLQFYGFLPRFILGLVFGYLFLWSDTLWLPVILHFLNNAVSVIAVYMNGVPEVNIPPDIPLWKQLIGLPLPIIVSIIILLNFKNKNMKNA